MKRRSRWLLLGCAGFLLMAASGTQEKVPEVLRTQKLDIVDAKGNKRAVLSTDEFATGLSLHAPTGQKEANLLLGASDGSASLSLSDGEGRNTSLDSSVGVSVSKPNGSVLLGPSGLAFFFKDQVVLSADPFGSISLMDKAGKIRWNAP